MRRLKDGHRLADHIAARPSRLVPRGAMEKLVQEIAREVAAGGGRTYYVGGYVRDRLQGRPCHDLDVEVYQLSLPALQGILKHHGRVHAVGRAFGVLKLTPHDHPEQVIDFSLPRRENLVGSGHRGFAITLDPDITPAEACARRDFTINAMLMDVLSEELHDFFDGQGDLNRGCLRHVSTAFAEDPLRVYRLAQFAGRLAMEAHPDTLALCRSMSLDELPAERIFAEFEKLLLLADRPSLGVVAAREAGILVQHPELAKLVGCPQDPEWHPEGDVWTHTLMSLDAAAGLRTGDRNKDLALMFGALCHDLGKPGTTGVKDGRIVSPGHADAGVEPAELFMERICKDKQLIRQVMDFVRYHLRPAEFYRVRDEIGDASIRRLALKVNLEDLVRLSRADHLGRTTPDALAKEFPAGEWLLARGELLAVKKEGPKPILQGRHLLGRGWLPGPVMGRFLETAFQAQLDGAFTEISEALEWLEENSTGMDNPINPRESR